MRRAAYLAPGLSLLLLLVCGWPAESARAQEKPEITYSVAVIPVVPPSETKRRWQPLLDQLARDTGLHFRFRFYEDPKSFENGLIHDEADFAVMSPLQAWRLRNLYRPQLRGNLALIGIVVVQKDSRIRQLSDLQGRALTLQEGDNHSANLLVLQSLKEQKITPQLRLVKTESNALRSVVLGKTDAAIVNNYALKFIPSGINAQLRIIYQTADLPPPPIAASLRLPAEDLQKVKTAMLRMQETHPELLQGILMPDLVEADLERDYGIVGKLLPSEAGNGNH
ncbi:MAG: phosphate/phosphite/phosphonate ABC transporter substrate-binding protein [Moraxellaceae bacterium]